MDQTRVLVVGASAGVGRAVARHFVAAGAAVVFSARRAEQLAEAVAEAGGGVTVPGDVRAPDGAAQVVAGAVAALGGLDVIVYATGISPLQRLRDVTRDQWSAVLETNLVGLHAVVRAALPHLAPGALVGALSSDSVGQPRPGLVPYAASKAALDELMRGWRTEHPEIRFSTIVIGPTFPTEFANSFDPALFAEIWGEWERVGITSPPPMDGDEVGDVIVRTCLAVLPHPGVGVEELVLRPPHVRPTDA